MSGRTKEPVEQEQQDISELLQIYRDKLAALQQTGKDPFEVTVCDRNASAQDIRDRFEEIEGQDVAATGCIMSWRDMGKASFMDTWDRTDRIQVYLKIDDIGEKAYHGLQNWDIGGLVSISGFVFRIHRGEISVHAKSITLLGKSLLPPPDKFHGLKDTDPRYRQRYVDLTVNPEVKSTFEKRSHVIATIHRILDKRGYVEVETPVLNLIPGGVAARPFITHHNTLDLDLCLRIAPKLCLKRPTVGGMEKVYETGRLFRNEGIDIKHNPEFTTIKLYEVYIDHHGMMDLTGRLVNVCAKKVYGTEEITYQGEEVSLRLSFHRMTMNDAIKQYIGVNFPSFKGDMAHVLEEAKEFHSETKATDSWGDITNLFLEEKVEGELVQSTFIYDYPVEVSPLAKRKKDVPELVERFELPATRHEFANAYFELNDPVDQHERPMCQMQLREAGDEEASMIDEDLLTALEYGIPPTGGMGIDTDRPAMLLTDSASIRDVFLFPIMKPGE